MRTLNTAILFLTSCAATLGTFELSAVPMTPTGTSPLMRQQSEDKRQIAVNNRILAKVHGKPISVVDVQKKLDVIFFGRFAEYASSATARHQFYLINWKPVLKELIDRELILADAEETKMEVSRSDVRQDIEKQFGPNVIVNLDKVGISLDEARKMVEGDIILNRMLMLRARVKAAGRVNPKVLRQAYDVYSQTHRRPTQWTYQLISVRHPDPEKGASAGRILAGLLNGKQITPQALADDYQTLDAIDEDTKVTVSEEYIQDEGSVSDAYRDILSTLSPGTFSEPQAQQSRRSNSTVNRIFYVKEILPGGVIPFNEVEDELYNELMGDAMETETNAYLSRLRRRAGLDSDGATSLVPETFEPFVLQ